MTEERKLLKRVIHLRRRIERLVVWAREHVVVFYPPLDYQAGMLKILEDKLLETIASKRKKAGSKPGPRPERRKKPLPKNGS